MTVPAVSVMAHVSSVLTSSVVNSSPNINRLRHYMLCKTQVISGHQLHASYAGDQLLLRPRWGQRGQGGVRPRHREQVQSFSHFIKYFWLIGCKYFSCRSTLVLREPGPADEGTYTCRPHQGMFRSAHTRLFMDQLASTATPTRPGTDFNCVILLVIHCIHFYIYV